MPALSIDTCTSRSRYPSLDARHLCNLPPYWDLDLDLPGYQFRTVSRLSRRGFFCKHAIIKVVLCLLLDNKISNAISLFTASVRNIAHLCRRDLWVRSPIEIGIWCWCCWLYRSGQRRRMRESPVLGGAPMKWTTDTCMTCFPLTGPEWRIPHKREGYQWIGRSSKHTRSAQSSQFSQSSSIHERQTFSSVYVKSIYIPQFRPESVFEWGAPITLTTLPGMTCYQWPDLDRYTALDPW